MTILQPLIDRIRTDITAIKLPNGGGSRWTTESLTPQRLAKHLNGGPARGCCPIKPGESVTMVGLFDLDSHKGETTWAEMSAVADRLAGVLEVLGCPVVPFRSSGGKGIHLLLLWDTPQDAYSVRTFMAEALTSIGFANGCGGVKNHEIEVFPKQNSVPVGHNGNQFILPLAGASVPLDAAFTPLDRESAIVWSSCDPVPVVAQPVREVSPPTDTPIELERLHSALAAIPNEPDNHLSYDAWRDIIFAIHFETAGSVDGYNLATEFSERSGLHDPEFFAERVWPYIQASRSNPITGATIFYQAREHGWNDVSVDDFDVVEDIQPEEPDQPPNHLHAEFPPPFRGVMAAVVEHALATAYYPQPALTTLAAVIGMASACCGRYHLPNGLRLNLYGCIVADSGTGKDATKAVAKELAYAAGAECLGRPASGAGLEDSLTDQQGMLLVMDEIAHFFATTNGSAAGAALVDLEGKLLELYSASRQNYRGRSLAKRTAPAVLENPTLNLLGLSTPVKLGEALGQSSVEDGLLGRFLLAYNTELPPLNYTDSTFILPEVAHDWGRAVQAALFENGAIPILRTPEAEALTRAVQGDFHLQRKLSDTQRFASALLARSAEKCERVAGVLAVGDNPGAPVVTVEHVEWARALVAASDYSLLHFSAEHMHGGDIQAMAGRLVRVAKKLLAEGTSAPTATMREMLGAGVVPRTMLLQYCNLTAQDAKQVLDTLESWGSISCTTYSSVDARGRNRETKGLLFRC